MDEGETALKAVIRECREEIGIDVSDEDLTFVHLNHRLCSDRTYYDIYFTVNKYTGKPVIMEPDKCSDLKWFDINKLPDDIVECRKLVIRYFADKISYSEIIEK